MSGFTQATLEPHPTIKGRFVLTTPGGVYFYLGHDETTSSVHIPEGFTSDGASGLPRWVWRLLPPGTRRALVMPSMLHDCMREDLRYPKPAGDTAFLNAEYATQVPPLLREIAFLGVRLNYSRARAA